ncbi:MAG TPA: UbiX family flavin prenyltransferase [Candidatus Tripitaka californicus]|uniref:UbiX family flavin prenyltransferase n=1 Tax=Candidatus Tripitaka californicus TaxID=3367616 RepID=UPI0040269EAE|nr:UbiX family flavin prenyltransferase [Planctomycetota bacterium]
MKENPEGLIVALTGASGMPYARRLLQVLCEKGIQVHLSISEAAFLVIREELGLRLDINNPDLEALVGRDVRPIWYHKVTQLDAPIASGSFPIRGMVIIPCSMNTLGAVANGLASNLIQRAASVALKENRRLILVPRETPLNTINLENMLKVARAGAHLIPAMPGFYHHPKTVEDLVDFMVARVLDSLQIGHDLLVPYEGPFQETGGRGQGTGDRG